MPGIPAAKIQKWRSTINNRHLSKFNNKPITSIGHPKPLISTSKRDEETTVTLIFPVIPVFPDKDWAGHIVPPNCTMSN